MKNNSKILIIILISSILTINYLGTNAQVNSIKMNNQEDNSLKVRSVPQTSGYAITEKWRHKLGSSFGFIDISEDGKYIVASNTTSVNLFHKNSNSTIWTYNSPTVNNFNDVGISWNGQYIVAAEDEQVYLLNKDPETPKTEVWKYPNSPSSADFKADISANGEYIAVGNSSGHVALLSNTPEVPKSYIWEIDLPTVIGDIEISGDGYYTIAGAEDGYVYLFNKTTTTTYEWRYQTTAPVDYVAISENGQYFLAANGDREVYLFNTTNPQGFMWNYTVSNPLKSAAFSYDGQYVVLCYNGNFEYFNNTFSASKLPMWSLNTIYMEVAVDISEDGKYIVASTNDRSLYFINNTVTSPKQEEWKDYSSSTISDVAISAAGNYFVGGVSGGTGLDNIYLLHHNRPLPREYYLLVGDDDDDDDEEAAIPFGSFYLIFTVLAMISLIVIMKRKMNIKKK